MSAEKLYNLVKSGKISPDSLNDEGKTALKSYISAKQSTAKSVPSVTLPPIDARKTEFGKSLAPQLEVSNNPTKNNIIQFDPTSLNPRKDFEPSLLNRDRFNPVTEQPYEPKSIAQSPTQEAILYGLQGATQQMRDIAQATPSINFTVPTYGAQDAKHLSPTQAKVAEIGGAVVGSLPGVGVSYLTGGKLAAKSLARTAPTASKLAQEAVRGAGAGFTYGATGEALDAAGDTRQDGSQGLDERLKRIAIDTGLGIVGDTAISAVGKGLKAAKSQFNNISNSIQQPISQISAFAKNTGEKLRRPKEPNSINDLIDVGGRPQKEKGTWEKFYSSIVNEQAPLERATKQIGGSKIPTESDPSKVAWLSRGWKGKADSMLEYGMLDKVGEKVGNSLKESLKPIRNKLNDWREYSVALRSIEYADVGLQSGVPKELSEKAIQKYASRPDVLQADKDIKEYVFNMNKSTLVDSGIWSEETLLSYQNTQPNYIPMFRTREKGIRDRSQSASGKGFGNVKDPTKKRTGSESVIVDPVESIIKQTYKNQALAERNNVMRSLVELAENNPENGIVQPLQKPSKAIDEIQKSLDEFIFSPTADMEDQLKNVLDLLKPQTVDGSPNVFTVMRNGKAEQWQIMDDQLASVVAGLGGEPSNPLVEFVGKATGILKAGLVLAPDFVLRNLIRDQMGAFINSKYGFIPLIDTISGLISATRKDKAFYQWMSNGGANGAWVSLERNYLQGQINKLTKTGIEKMGNPVEVLRKLSEWSEQGTRLGEFKRGLKKGASLKDAALSSRDVTLDFSRTGSKTKSANKMIAFFNVAVQSIDKMARQFKAHPVKTTAKSAISITVPSMILYALNHDDPKYQELPQWEKDTYWHLFLGDETLRIPKPFEMGTIFGTFPERMMQSVAKDDPKAFEGFAKDVLAGFTPSIIPTLLVPWIEAYSNKDTFTKAPIVPRREEGLEKPDQFGPYTSELSKDVGKLTNQSPRVLENYVTGYTGTLGRYGLQAADNLYKAATNKQTNEKPDFGLAGTVGIKSFFSKGLEGSSKSVDEFYKEKEKFTRERNSLRKEGKGYEKEGQYQLYNRIGDEISKQQSVARSITEDKTLSGKEKRDTLKRVNLQIINLARIARGLNPIDEE